MDWYDFLVILSGDKVYDSKASQSDCIDIYISDAEGGIEPYIVHHLCPLRVMSPSIESDVSICSG